jgi:hypothetical protein
MRKRERHSRPRHCTSLHKPTFAANHLTYLVGVTHVDRVINESA